MNEPKPMSTTMLKKWTRYPANQERRMDAAYSIDDMTSFSPVLGREFLRTPR